MKEVEATLIICAEYPRETLAGIAALPSISGYPLLPQAPASINDYYVDTAEDSLRRCHVNLRLREANGSLWLTLKGPPRYLGPGIEERLEVEVLWSQEGLERVSQELASHGVHIPGSLNSRGGPRTTPNRPDGPRDALSAMGLELIQRRENYRQIRDIMPSGQDSGPRLAELGLDSVTYYLEGRQIHHYEVEIEAKSEAGIQSLPVIAQALVDAYPLTLQRWDHGKLSTGRAIAALLRQGTWRGLLNGQDQLTPLAYQKVHQSLSG